MKNLVMACCLSFLVTAAFAQGISQKERSFAVNYLEESRYHLLREIEGLTQDEWSFKPSAEQWSIAQVAEHIALAENGLYHLVVDKLINGEASPEKKEKYAGRDSRFIHVVADRPQKAQTLERFEPMESQKWSSPEEFVLYFNNLRDRTIDFVKNTDIDLRLYYSNFTPMVELDAYQWSIFTGAHTKRHLLQIGEIKEAMALKKEGDDVANE
ncbi:MAG: DinB family protein [Cyclobacteriaceae bacterium]